MIIVAGRIHIAPGRRREFLALSASAIASARSTRGCSDFVVAPDPIDPDRVNVYEEWTDRAALDAFRGDGPPTSMTTLIARADVREYDV